MDLISWNQKNREPNRTEPNTHMPRATYQYPKWRGIEEGAGSSLQYITYDQEVEVFIQMRRQIEEVNLFVSVAVHTNGTKLMFQRTEQRPCGGKDKVGDDGESSDAGGYETDDEWHTLQCQICR